MNREELRALVTQMLEELPSGSTQSSMAVNRTVNRTENKVETGYKSPVKTYPETSAHVDQGGEIPDITKIDLRKQYLVENGKNKEAFMALKEKTSARIGVGKCGTRYHTITQLRFRADHAAAQDSVFSEVPKSFYETNHYIYVKTKCKDKDEYLTRPDLGRRFNGENEKIIKSTCGAFKILLVVGDGLSSQAVETNAPDCAAAITQGLSAYGITLGKTLFIQYCRVGASDHIGSMTNADLVCMLVGERPGLVTAQSMSAYITYAPRIGVPESSRTVVSNIHKDGTPAVEAGAHIASLIQQMLKKKCSGVVFRQEEQ